MSQATLRIGDRVRLKNQVGYLAGIVGTISRVYTDVYKDEGPVVIVQWDFIPKEDAWYSGRLELAEPARQDFTEIASYYAALTE